MLLILKRLLRYLQILIKFIFTKNNHNISFEKYFLLNYNILRIMNPLKKIEYI